MAKSLIDLTLEEINLRYRPGMLAWVKTNGQAEWRKMLTLEGEINQAALRGDSKILKEVLAKYRKLLFTMIEGFSSSRGTARNLFENRTS